MLFRISVQVAIGVKCHLNLFSLDPISICFHLISKWIICLSLCWCHINSLLITIVSFNMAISSADGKLVKDFQPVITNCCRPPNDETGWPSNGKGNPINSSLLFHYSGRTLLIKCIISHHISHNNNTKKKKKDGPCQWFRLSSSDFTLDFLLT